MEATVIVEIRAAAGADAFWANAATDDAAADDALRSLDREFGFASPASERGHDGNRSRIMPSLKSSPPEHFQNQRITKAGSRPNASISLATTSLPTDLLACSLYAVAVIDPGSRKILNSACLIRHSQPLGIEPVQYPWALMSGMKRPSHNSPVIQLNTFTTTDLAFWDDGLKTTMDAWPDGKVWNTL